MAYDKYTWEAGETVTAGKLNHIENGIEEASQTKGANILNVWIGQNESPKSVNNGIGPYSLYYDEELTEKICDAYLSDYSDNTGADYAEVHTQIEALREIFETPDLIKYHMVNSYTGDTYSGIMTVDMIHDNPDWGDASMYLAYIGMQITYAIQNNYPMFVVAYYGNSINAE